MSILQTVLDEPIFAFIFTSNPLPIPIGDFNSLLFDLGIIILPFSIPRLIFSGSICSLLATNSISFVIFPFLAMFINVDKS